MFELELENFGGGDRRRRAAAARPSRRARSGAGDRRALPLGRRGPSRLAVGGRLASPSPAVTQAEAARSSRSAMRQPASSPVRRCRSGTGARPRARRSRRPSARGAVATRCASGRPRARSPSSSRNHVSGCDLELEPVRRIGRVPSRARTASRRRPPTRRARTPRSAPRRARARPAARAPPSGTTTRPSAPSRTRRPPRPRTRPRGTSSRRRRGRRRRRPRRARSASRSAAWITAPEEIAAEDPFALEQEPQAGDRLCVRDEELAVELRHVEDRRHVAVRERAEAHDLVSRERLGGGDGDLRERLAQPLSRPHQRPAGPEPGHEHVDAVEGGRDLRAGSLVVRARVRLVRVLERHEERGVALRELERQADGAVRALLRRRVDDLGAVQPEQAPTLLGDVRRHHAGQRIPAEFRDERERDAGVAARRLEQPPPGRELARGLGGLDHRLRDAVFDRAGRVLALELREQAHGRLRRQPRKLDERRRADEVEHGSSHRHA